MPLKRKKLEIGGEHEIDVDSDIKHSDVIRYAGSMWRNFSVNRKRCWNLRAIRLNTTPVVGKFLVVPSFLNSGTLCEFITTDWNNACKVLRSAIMREPCRDMSQK
jgi:hypothetical protein